jgi:hypothetical protein
MGTMLDRQGPVDGKIVKKDGGKIVTVKESIHSADKKIYTIDESIRRLEAERTTIQRQQSEDNLVRLTDKIAKLIEEDTGRIVVGDGALYEQAQKLAKSALNHGTRMRQREERDARFARKLIDVITS